MAFAGAWLRGWPPARLWRAAAWALPMTAVYLAARALHARTWRGLASAPFHDWQHAWHLAQHGQVLARVCAVRPGGGARGAGRSGHCVGVADLRHRNRHHRQDRHRPGRVRRPAVATAGPHRPRPHHRPRHRAADRPARPGGDGRHHPRDRPPLAPGHRHPAHRDGPAPGRHRRIRVGEDEPDDAHLGRVVRRRPPRPPSTRASRARCCWCWTAKAAPTPAPKPPAPAACCTPTGAGRVAVWPDEATISLWDLPPRDLAVTLFQMIDTGTGDAAYYADVTQAVLTLAVTAPPGPPANGTEFLARLDPGWLADRLRRGPGPAGRRARRPRPAPRHRPALPHPAGPARPRPGRPGGTWPTRTPGTSSWKAPANTPSPKPRPWR